ncbi:HlyD family efflux transporter periplasmic adaptor subunit [Alteromonadaceae bacterium M269]|nr:HlyD family efflux transporter periplasmic adaptor subunit [Alteromonadaceae bacterium M269]
MKVYITLLFALFLLSCSTETVSEKEASNNSQIEAPAELISLKEAYITPPSINRMWQYKIEYLIPENSLVKKGDVILKFDSEQLDNRLFDERSKLNAALKELEKQTLDDNAKQQDLVLDLAEANMEFDRAQRKVSITDESRSEVERKKQQLDFEIAQLKLEQAKKSLSQHDQTTTVNAKVSESKISGIKRRIADLETSIAKLTINAPKEGLVVYQAGWQGNKPAAGETVPQGTTLMTLPSIDQLAVKAEFDESDTSLLHVGQSVKITLDAYPERPFAGEITSLGQAYRAKSNNNLKVVFDATIALNQSEQAIMRPGMKARVVISEIQG